MVNFGFVCLFIFGGQFGFCQKNCERKIVRGQNQKIVQRSVERNCSGGQCAIEKTSNSSKTIVRGETEIVRQKTIQRNATKKNIDPAAQQHAEREAMEMSRRGVCSHLLGCAKGAIFSGVGVSRNPNPKTCVPWENGSSANCVIADAIVERNGWFYRSTHWR